MINLRPFFTFFFLGAVFIFTGCIGGQAGKKKADCLSGQEFDTSTRSCKGAIAASASVPIPTLSSMSLQEDAGLSQTLLRYSDSEGDLAFACEVRSLSSVGLIKTLNSNDIRFTSRPTILDAHNTYIKFTSGVGLALNTFQLGDIRYLDITFLSGVTTVANVVTAILANPTANSWVSPVATGLSSLSATASYANLTEIPCSCSGGSCYADLIPVDHFPNGISNPGISVFSLWPNPFPADAISGLIDFEYRLTDSDGISNFQTVQLQVSAQKDAPLITGALIDLTTTEDITGSMNLLTGAGLSFEELDNSSVYFVAVGLPPNGSIILNSSTGLLNYTPHADFNGADQMTFKVCTENLDGPCSANYTLSINVTAAPDRPKYDNYTIPSIIEDSMADGTNDSVVLNWTDVDGLENMTACTFNSLASTGVYVSSPCSCSGDPAICTIGVTAKAHFNGTGSFWYQVISDTAPDNTSDSIQVSFSVDAVEDNPVALGSIVTASALAWEDGVSTSAENFGRLQFTESKTHIPNFADFEINGAFLADTDDIVSAYEIVTAPANGILTNCMNLSGSSGNTDLSCRYTPNDGNNSDGVILSDSAVDKGWVLLNSGVVRFVAVSFGDSSDELSVQMIHAEGVGGGNEEAWLDGNTIKVLYEAGVSTGADIKMVIETSGPVSVQGLIEVDNIGGTTTAGDELTYTLSSGTATADKFVYRVLDSDGNYSANKTFHISIIPVDDNPVVCEYSSYSEEPSCGLNGCIGSTSPMALTSVNEGASYVDENSGACWKYSSGSWGLVKSLVKDRSVNELQTIVIDKVIVDEGGGNDSSENTQELRLINIDSSNTALIPTSNIRIVFSGTGTCDTISDNCNGDSLPVIFGSNSAVSGEETGDFSFHITPVSGQTGNSVIELTFSDALTGNETEVDFTITVNANSASHGGWVSFSSTGPKVNNIGQVVEEKNHCPYTLDLCNNGQSCNGFSEAATITPDHVNSVYLKESGTNQTCYRVKRTTIQNISYAPKSSSFVSITYVDGAVSPGSETVGVTGSGTVGSPYIITVTMKDGGSTTEHLIAAIEGDSSADTLVKAIKLKASETEDAQSAQSIGNLSSNYWEEFQTTCSITPSDYESSCSFYGDSCQGNGAPTVIPTTIDSRYFDEENNQCYRSIGTSATTDWVAFEASGEVSITWNQFSIFGSDSITEYRVYRRLPNENYDYDAPINRTMIEAEGSEIYTFVDNYANSFEPPTPQTVYFYEVRPVIAGSVTGTNQSFRELRMMVPPKNMSFVHRWMANKTMCEYLNKTPDSSNNYRCSYKGPGDMTSGGVQYYDIEKDYLVDRFEAGCPYSVASACTNTSDGSCIGVGNPTSLGVVANNDSVYYDRSSAKCYLRNAGSWSQITSTPMINNFLSAVDNRALVPNDIQNDELTDADYNRAHLPPLVHVNQEDAHHFCQNVGGVNAIDIYGINLPLFRKLPSRKEQIAYSQWEVLDKSDNALYSKISDTETGLGLGSSSKCNSTSANELLGFSNDSIPSSTNFYSLPGTEISGVRSLITGSDQTKLCSSQYGVQDMVGNVAEWTTMRISCDNLSTCSIETGAQKLASDLTADYSSSDLSEFFGQWALNGYKGPCIDDNSDGVCDRALTSWLFQESNANNAELMLIPMGLVVSSDFLTVANGASNADLAEIGQSTGIENFKLTNDIATFNTDKSFAGSTHCGGMATGGHYTSSNGGGVWSHEFVPCDNDAYGAVTIEDISYRSLIAAANTITIRYVDGVANPGDNIAGPIVVSGNNIIVDLADLGGDRTATNIANTINTHGAANLLVEAVVSGFGLDNQNAFGEAKNLENFATSAQNARDDIGFRCVIPIDPSISYDE